MIRSPKIVDKEKQLVFKDRAANAAAVVVVRQMTQWASEIRPGIDRTILDKLECRTMKCIRARLESNVRDCADGAAKLRFEIVRRYID